jgi:hypothetical protein
MSWLAKRHGDVATVGVMTTAPGHAGVDAATVRAMFVTTEHHALQSARATAITESTNRAGIFMGAVSAGLIALSLTATVTQLRLGFYILSVVLLSSLAFIGFATFDRVLRSGIEAVHYGERIARLRAYYFDSAPELTQYLAGCPSPRPRAVRGLEGRHWRFYRTVAGMIGTVTAVLSGVTAGTITEIVTGNSVPRGWGTAGVVGVGVLAGLIRVHDRVWRQASRDGTFG